MQADTDRHRFSAAAQTAPLARLGLLRWLLDLGLAEALCRQPRQQVVAKLRRLGVAVGAPETTPPVEHVLAILRRMRAPLEHANARLTIPSRLAGPLDDLAVRHRLTPGEKRVLKFALLLRQDNVLSEAAPAFGPIDDADLSRVLAVTLPMPAAAVTKTLQPQGRLVRLGLVEIAPGEHPLLDKLRPGPAAE